MHPSRAVRAWGDSRNFAASGHMLLLVWWPLHKCWRGQLLVVQRRRGIGEQALMPIMRRPRTPPHPCSVPACIILVSLVHWLIWIFVIWVLKMRRPAVLNVSAWIQPHEASNLSLSLISRIPRREWPSLGYLSSLDTCTWSRGLYDRIW